MRFRCFYSFLLFFFSFFATSVNAAKVNCYDYFVNTNKNTFLNGAIFGTSYDKVENAEDCSMNYQFHNGDIYTHDSSLQGQTINVSQELNDYFVDYYTSCTITNSCPPSIMEMVQDRDIIIVDPNKAFDYVNETDPEKLEVTDPAFEEINKQMLNNAIYGSGGDDTEYDDYYNLVSGLCQTGPETTVANMQSCSTARDIVEIMNGDKSNLTISGKHKKKLEDACKDGYSSNACQAAVQEVSDSIIAGEGIYMKGGTQDRMQEAMQSVAEDNGSPVSQLLGNNGITPEQFKPIIEAMQIQLKEEFANDPQNEEIEEALDKVNNAIISGDYNDVRDELYESLKNGENSVLTNSFTQMLNVNSVHETNRLFDSSQYKGTTYEAVLTNYKDNNSGCWFCSIFGKAFQAINNITTQIFNTLKEPLLPLLSVGLALWIVFLVLRFFSSFQGMDPGQFFGLFSKGIFKGFIATVLLTAGPSFIFGYTLTPVLELGGAFSQKIIESDTDFSTYEDSELGSFSPCSIITLGESSFPKGSAFSYEAFKQLDCMMRTASWRVVNGLAVGASIVSLVFKEANIFSFFSMFDILLMGCLIWLGHFVMLIVLPLKLIDILAHIAFVGALMPLLIITWVFQEWKNSYAKRALEIFVGACFTFIMLSLLLILSLRIITFAIPTDENCQNATPGMMACPNTENGKQGLLTVLKNGEDVEDLQNEVDFTGMQIFVTLGACFFAWKLLDSASDLAEELTGFSSPGTELSSAANKPLMAGVAVAGGAAGTIGIGLGRLGKDKIKDAWQNRKITKSRYASPTQSGKSSGPRNGPQPQTNSNTNPTGPEQPTPEQKQEK